MIKQLGVSHLSGSQLLYIAFVAYANYQVSKWILVKLRNFLGSDFLRQVIFKMTPQSVLQKREVRRKLKIHHARIKKEKDHKEALELHRRYKAPFFNLQFIAEDRRTLFKGHDDIKWLQGNKNVGKSKKPWVVENQEIAFLMFQEMAAYRWQFLKTGKWTPEMENFWVKILPKKFISKDKNKEMTQIEKALADFDDDIPVKASA